MTKKRGIILISINVLLLIGSGIIFMKYIELARNYGREPMYQEQEESTYQEQEKPIHEEYDTRKEKCEYVNRGYDCGHYDCSKNGYYNNYLLCRGDYASAFNF